MKAITANRDARLELFCRGLDNSVWHNWQTSAAGPWSGFQSLGAGTHDDIEVGMNIDGRLEIFIINDPGNCWHTWQTSAGGTSWAAWEDLGGHDLGGGLRGTPTISLNWNGELELFARDNAGQLWHNQQTAANGPWGWSGWNAFGGGTHNDCAVGSNAARGLDVFLINDPGNCWHSWQTAPGGTWMAWQDLGGHDVGGGLRGTPVVVFTYDGRMDLFARDDGGLLSHNWQIDRNDPSGWSGWNGLGGGTHNDCAVARNNDGRLELFIINDHGDCWHCWQTTLVMPSPKVEFHWSDWENLGGSEYGLTGAPAVWRNYDGRLEVFARGTDPPYLHNWQVSPGGGWAGFQRVGANISHIFVLMLENRSFDHMFGYSGLRGQDASTGAPTEVDGLLGSAGINLNPNTGAPIATERTAPYSLVGISTDVEHEFLDVLRQLAGPEAVPADGILPGGNYPPIDNSGFVADFVEKHPGSPPETPMQCFASSQLPVITALAREFAVCDRWFAALPGPTWPNRFWIHGASPTDEGQVDSPPNTNIGLAITGVNPYHYHNGTVYDLIYLVGRKHRIYAGDNCPQVKGIRPNAPGLSLDIGGMDSFATELQDAAYPFTYVFIEPDYGVGGYPGLAADYCASTLQNDMHPPTDVRNGEELVRRVYETIRNSPVWASSVLIITFDEHGGFFDHIVPPQAIPPGDGAVDNTHGFGFNQHGVRVPAIVISPWIPRNTVDHTQYDHTSVIATMTRMFLAGPLTERDRAAADLWHLFSLPTARNDAPQHLSSVLPAPVWTTSLDSWVSPDQYQHVVFESGDGHVCELFLHYGSGTWGIVDLTAATGTEGAKPGASLSSWVSADNYQHVVFATGDGHVHELFLQLGTTTWASGDLTASTGAPPAGGGSALTTWFSPDNYQHVVFASDDGHVHELFLLTGTTTWDTVDLTSLTRASPAAPVGGLSSWVSPDNYQHVTYIGADGHVYELFLHFGGGVWGVADLTAATGAPTARLGSLLSTWVSPDNYQHVVFVSDDGHVHELFLQLGTTTWETGDLTSQSYAPPAASTSSLSTWVSPDNNQHVVFASDDGHVHELFLQLGTTIWTSGDLTTSSGAPPATRGSTLSSWVSSDNYQHVVFALDNGHVHELFLQIGTTVWGAVDLTALTKAPPAT